MWVILISVFLMIVHRLTVFSGSLFVCSFSFVLYVFIFILRKLRMFDVTMKMHLKFCDMYD
jgi:hypothetical protein